ncbi:FecR family protein [Mangrovibacterium sp.]|uniref:FecR family protein n=1 Tax=Mangrovibacterium sp. TaxID=1961364 RepID=UPI003563B16F
MSKASKNSLLCTFLVLPDKQNRIDEQTRAYRVPARKDKPAAFDEVLAKIEDAKVQQILTKAPVIKSGYRAAISIAAVLAIVFLAQFFLFSQITFETHEKSISFRLPDKSRVVLGTNSTLNYPKYRWNKKLNLQGEAYFEVIKGQSFVVETGKGTVRVLGTRFTVAEIENLMKVGCYEGKVVFNKNNTEVIIPAGTSSFFEQGNLVKNEKLEVDYPNLAFFRGSYSDDDLQTVLSSLEDFFQVSIHLETRNPQTFSGQLETGSLKVALNIISESLKLDYKFETGENITIKEKPEELREEKKQNQPLYF